ncbi:MAG: hypothetical protein GY861_03235 [bacterium]|nr:hypothetical protein [bacterium]
MPYQPYNPDSYQNPTQPSGLNPTFGSDDQFNIPGNAITPFNFGQQRGENTGFINDFTGFLQGQETLPAIQQRYENRFGIPDLRENYLRTKEAGEMIGNQIRGLPESINQRTQESMITQGQRDKILNKEAGNLIDIFNSLGQITESIGNRLAMGEQNLNQAAKLEMAQLQKDTQPWLMKYELMNIMQTREFTGWGTVQSLELNRLFANQASGLDWDQGKEDRLNKLAMQENQFAHELNLLEKESQYFLDLWG